MASYVHLSERGIARQRCRNYFLSVRQIKAICEVVATSDVFE
ncbi:MAG: hypothetical protein ABGZ23_01445 [Fuerstiella sp.]